MIYLPKRALFIHIPRTAGNSITNAIATSCAGNNFDMLIGTVAHNPANSWSKIFQTHARAEKLRPYIDDWDEIFKFAIYRPNPDRLKSAERLIERDIQNKTYDSPACDEYWKKVLLDKNYRDQFLKDFESQGVNFYTKVKGKDAGVELFRFIDLKDKWDEICYKCRIPKCELKHLNKG